MKNESVEQLIYELVETGVFESIGDGISIQDTDFKILYQNSKHKLFVGEHNGELCYEAYEKRSHICEGCPLEMTFKDGLPHTEERTAPTDRGISHFEITASPLRDRTGKIIAGIEVARDVTGRKRDEEARKENEEKYRLLFTGEQDAIVLVDAATQRIVDANDSALLLYGYSRKEILKLCGPALSAEPEKSIVAIKEIAKQTAKYIHYHTRLHKKKDGTVFPVEISSGNFMLQGKKIVSALIRDITERKKAEEELRVSEARNKAILTAIPDLMFRMSSKGVLLYHFAPDSSDLYGKPEEFIGKKVDEVLPPDVGKRYQHYIQKTLDSKQLQEFKYELPISKGVQIFEARMVVSGKNEVLVIVRNITERRKLEEELQKMQKLESIGILAGGIAHDFNNLLAGIANNIYLSQMSVNRESKTYDNLKSAEKAIHRATNLTRQLLTFSSGGAPVKKTASIIEIIKESAEFVISGSNVTCQYNVADNLWPVKVDEGQISQGIHNLILNADQAMPEGGTIQIHVKNVNLESDTGLPLKEGRYIKIIIQDQGTGLPEELIQKLFDPYFTTKEMGRGLGLSITYSIIKHHEGHISVESEMGAGTTFTIYLPASEEQIEEKESRNGAFLMGQGYILLMDDEEIIRDSIGELLSMIGYEIEYAENGEKALELYKKAMKTSKPFNAVILDLTIRGGMGGKETIKKMLEIDPNVKAIVSSGYSNDPVTANYREYGFTGILAKPCRSLEDLNKLLHKVIN